MNNKHYEILDIARAVCALQIIGIWHMCNYVFQDSVIMHGSYFMTTIALAGFTFISGILAGASNKTGLTYYRSRVERLFVPFLISYFLLISIGLNQFSIRNFVLTITGFCCFTDYQPYTLWYVSMLLVFYAVTPLIKNSHKIVRSIVFFCIILIYYVFQHNDYRIVFYSVFYLIGLNLKITQLTNLIANKYMRTIAIVSVASICMTFNKPEYYDNKVIMFFVAFTGIPLLFILSNYFTRIKSFRPLFANIAYSSMFAYLLHRYICFHLSKILGVYIQDFILMPLLLIAIFITSYYCQVWYDKVIGSFHRSN